VGEHQHPGRLYVGLGNRVAVFDPQGTALAVWQAGFNAKTLTTSMAIGEDDIFVADAGNRVVVRLNLKGELLGHVGRADASRGVHGFVIPSPYFDVAVTADGLLRVANPGARRIETFTFDGDVLGHWGHASAEIAGFFGCCNPSHFVVLPDGRFVTAEKGIPRVKIYSPRGDLECVVADPEMLDQKVTAIQLSDEGRGALPVFDVAADRRGRILVLDPVSRAVRVFEEKEGTNDASKT
jgi:hypothetical protein